MSVPSATDLKTKNKTELIALCKDKNIKGYSGKTKDELIEILCQGEIKNEETLTGKFRTDEKEQFYTDPKVAKKCIDIVLNLYPNLQNYLWIEPSAGNGSFYNLIENKKIGIDIDPKCEGIIKDDFLKWKLPSSGHRIPDPSPKAPNQRHRIILIGNPPFGKQSSLAKMFIKRGCEYADIIAFILPKSFTKPSMNNAFDKMFHCMHTSDIEKDAFLIQGNERYDVPCVFQIWERKNTERKLEEKITEIGFEYIKEENNPHICIRRVGALAGKSFLYQPDKFSVQSHYFIRLNNIENINEIIKGLNNHTFPSNTVGPRSISKGEVNIVLNSIILCLGSVIQTYEDLI